MMNVADPYRTGRSKITGKLVTVRHATGRDLMEIREYLKKHHGGCIQKGAEVVAVQDVRLIAFGITLRIDGHERIVVRDLRKGSRLGPLIVRHIKEFARPVAAIREDGETGIEGARRLRRNARAAS
jgi:hypothetical protein